MGIIISFGYILCQFKFGLKLGMDSGEMKKEIGSCGNVGSMDGSNRKGRMKTKVGIKQSSTCHIMNQIVVLKLCKTDPLYPVILLIGAEVLKILFDTLINAFCLAISLWMKSGRKLLLNTRMRNEFFPKRRSEK